MDRKSDKFLCYNKNLARGYLLDLISILKDEALDAVKRWRLCKEKGNSSDFEDGYALAYSRVISLMMQQAESFNIPLEELFLDDIDPDKDLAPA